MYGHLNVKLERKKIVDYSRKTSNFSLSLLSKNYETSVENYYLLIDF